MIRTDNFVRALADKGLVDDIMVLENGYDIQYKNNILSVRLNNKGGALLYNQRKNSVMNIESGRLDEVLHRYIVQSLFGTQTKEGTQGRSCKDTFFVPAKVIRNSVVFEDPEGRKFTVKGNSPKAVLSYFDEAAKVNADDTLVLLNGFDRFDIHTENTYNKAETVDLELQLLKCSLNIDDYAVAPKSEYINDVGQTLVGNFLCSSADKVNMMTFEEDSSKAFNYNSTAKRNITSATMRTRNPFAMKTKEILNSSVNKKIVTDYADMKYPEGLCISAMEQMLAYDAPAIFSSANIDNPIEYKNLFLRYLGSSNRVQFRLDTNKSIYCALIKDNESVAKFRAIPIVSEIRESLIKEGYLISELEAGLEFDVANPAVPSVVSSCKNFEPVAEKVINTPNTVSKMIGSDCQKVLEDFGIKDNMKVFSSVIRVIVN